MFISLSIVFLVFGCCFLCLLCFVVSCFIFISFVVYCCSCCFFAACFCFCVFCFILFSFVCYCFYVVACCLL